MSVPFPTAPKCSVHPLTRDASMMMRVVEILKRKLSEIILYGCRYVLFVATNVVYTDQDCLDQRRSLVCQKIYP